MDLDPTGSRAGTSPGSEDEAASTGADEGVKRLRNRAVGRGAAAEGAAAEGAVAAWAEDFRANEAAAARARSRWRSRQAAEGSRLVEVLDAWQRAGSDIVLQTLGGRRGRGSVLEVGDDFASISGSGDVWLAALRSVAFVEAVPTRALGRGGPARSSAHPSTSKAPSPPRPKRSMRAALDALVDSGIELRVVLGGAAPPVEGELQVVGEDYAVLGRRDAPGQGIYVPLDAIDVVVIPEPGGPLR